MNRLITYWSVLIYVILPTLLVLLVVAYLNRPNFVYQLAFVANSKGVAYKPSAFGLLTCLFVLVHFGESVGLPKRRFGWGEIAWIVLLSIVYVVFVCFPIGLDQLDWLFNKTNG